MTNRYFIYEHRRVDTGEVFYIGKGTWTPNKRYIRAATTSKRNIHWKRIVAKAGGFTHSILAEFVDEAEALADEVRRIAECGRANLGGLLCNITAGGEGQSGIAMTTEVRRKISAAHMGRPKPDHVKAAVSAAQKGVPNPEWQNKAHSLKMSGAGNPNFGKKNSPETIAKRVATRGRKCSGSDSHFYGKPQPEYVKAKLREANSRPVFDDITGIRYSSVTAASIVFRCSNSTMSKWLRGVRPNPTGMRFA